MTVCSLQSASKAYNKRVVRVSGRFQADQHMFLLKGCGCGAAIALIGEPRESEAAQHYYKAAAAQITFHDNRPVEVTVVGKFMSATRTLGPRLRLQEVEEVRVNNLGTVLCNGTEK